MGAGGGVVSTLPAPPEHSTGPTGAAWSIVTLAAHLCVNPAVVDALTADTGRDEDNPDIHSIHPFQSYLDGDGDWISDCWMHDGAAERIATQFPAAGIARAVLAAEMPTLSGSALRVLAEHVVTHGGAA